MAETIVAHTLFPSLHQKRLFVTSFKEILFSKILAPWAREKSVLNIV